MSISLRPSLILVLVTFVNLLLCAESAKPDIIEKLTTSAEKDIKSNRATYDNANSMILDTVEKALKAEMEKLTKSGKLDEAVAVKAALSDFRLKIVKSVDEAAYVNLERKEEPTGLAILTIKDADLSVLKNGEAMVSNRDYTIGKVSDKLAGLTFTKNTGNQPRSIMVDVIKPGYVLMAVCKDADLKGIEKAGWKAEPELNFEYSAKGGSEMMVYKKVLSAKTEVPSFGGFTGTVLIFKREGK